MPKLLKLVSKALPALPADWGDGLLVISTGLLMFALGCCAGFLDAARTGLIVATVIFACFPQALRRMWPVPHPSATRS